MPKKQAEYTRSEFIDYNLTVEEKKALVAWKITPDELLGLIDRVIESDYKVTVRYDPTNECYAAWLIPDIVGTHPHVGLILSARGGSASKALKQLFFKHYTIFEEQWVNSKVRQRKDWEE